VLTVTTTTWANKAHNVALNLYYNIILTSKMYEVLIHWISNHRQLTSGPPNLGLGQGLTTPCHKNQHVVKCCTGLQTWMGSLAWPEKWTKGMRFGTFKVISLKFRVTEGSCNRICMVYLRFIGNTEVQMGEEWHWTSKWLHFVLCKREWKSQLGTWLFVKNNHTSIYNTRLC